MIKGIFTLFLFLFSPLAITEPYLPITPPQATSAYDKIEVVEIFWYGCPHCYLFEPHIQKWLENKPEDVVFVRIPAIFNNEKWLVHAKAFYTAAQLGILDKIHRPLFDALHKEKHKLYSEAALQAFFVDQQVDADEFTRVYNSEAVRDRLKQALRLTKGYKITGVPAIVVEGKYLINSKSAGSQENIMPIVDELIEQERRSRQQAI